MRILIIVVVLLCSPLTWGQGSSAQAGQPSLAQAHSLLEDGKTSEALDVLTRLAAIEPQAKNLQHEFGVAYYRTGKLIEAQKAFTAAIAESPADQESVQMLGLTYYRLGRPGEAIPYLERVRQWMPNANADSNYVLGLCYLNAQRYDDARRAFATGFGVPADSGSAHLILGSMLIKANLPEIGALEAQKAVQLSPELPLAHFLLGEAYLVKSDVDHAITEFEAERRLNPGYAPVYDRLGDAYSRINKLEEAQEALTKALSLDQSSTGPFIQMGKVLLRRQDPATAILYLKHAEKMDPENFITHTLLAQAYKKMGQEEDAKHQVELASKIHAANQLVLQPVE